MARTLVNPRIGAAQIQKLTPLHFDALYSELLRSGRKNGGPLSPRSVRMCHAMLHRALADAVDAGLLVLNSADRAKPPSAKSARAPEMPTWSAEELCRFLEHVRSDRFYAAWLLFVSTGMRRGELLGLRWRDLDLEHGRLALVQILTDTGYELRFGSPKTAKGRRAVELDAATVDALPAHKKRQAEERLAFGPAFEDHGLVFCQENGEPIRPHVLSNAIKRHARAAGLPVIRLHDLRHSSATLALQASIHPKVVSERLGHSSVSITLDRYSHVSPSMQKDAAARMAALVSPEPRSGPS